MNINLAEFVTSYADYKQMPASDRIEIAFSGRSNVGKSSLINKIFNRKNLARTSSSPGKTVTINFYAVNEMFYLVDLPGYGYSKMSKQEQEKVGSFIEQYLFNSKKICLIIFLIDIRHSPTDNDKLMYKYIISSNKPFIILANKADKIAPTKVKQAVYDLQKEINPLMDNKMLPFSSEKKIYSDDVWDIIEKYI